MPNKKPFTQAAAAFIVLALALVPLTPAFASDQGVIVGSLLTENNEPIQGKGIRFIERVPLSEGSWRLGDSTIAYTDKNGRFIVQATLGTYLVTVGPGKTQSGSRCLNTSFLYEVTQDRQNLEIVTPKLMTYSIQFSDTDGKKLVAGVRPYFRNVKFSSKASPGLGELSFYCDSEFFNTEPKFIWETFEISQNQNLPDQARY